MQTGISRSEWVERECADVYFVQALKGVWVNIYDLVDAVRTGSTPPRRFLSRRALAEYTISHHKVYPKKKAKKGGPVRALLAHIFDWDPFFYVFGSKKENNVIESLSGVMKLGQSSSCVDDSGVRSDQCTRWF
jgi:hypothetical protein